MRSTTLVLCLLLFAAGIARGAPAGARSVVAATASIVRYNAEEARLRETAVVAPATLLAHWRQLAAIRARLGRLPPARAWRGEERLALRHALAQLLGQVVVVERAGGWVERAIAAAARRRRDDLGAIARWSNRHLDFAIDRGFAQALDDFPARAAMAGATASR